MHYHNLLTTRISRRGILAAPFALFLVLAGCSMVDTPAPTPTQELDVRNYYIQLATPRLEYNYTVTSNAPFHPPVGQLTMDMQGVEDTVNGIPVYSCLWSYGTYYGAPTAWYYGLNDSQAINLGIESAGQLTDHWVDLQAPLSKDKSWSFTSQGESITASILKYGATAQVNGQSYSDVIMVNYSGANGTSGTEWFQRGKGLIYYNITRPNFGTIENQLISIVQK